MNPDSIAKLHALCVAAIGRSWGEVSVYAGEELLSTGLVQLNPLGTPYLTDDGEAVFREALAAMEERL